jgi:hypothetical protein
MSKDFPAMEVTMRKKREKEEEERERKREKGNEPKETLFKLRVPEKFRCVTEKEH